MIIKTLKTAKTDMDITIDAPRELPLGVDVKSASISLTSEDVLGFDDSATQAVYVLAILPFQRIILIIIYLSFDRFHSSRAVSFIARRSCFAATAVATSSLPWKRHQGFRPQSLDFIQY